MNSSKKTPTDAEADLGQMVEALGRAERLLLTTHENPDGDALGSLLAAKLGLQQLGKDPVAFLTGSAALPREYAFMGLGDVLRSPPSDASERTLVALDCASAKRLGDDEGLVRQVPLVLNIDHHHDNTRFGHRNLVMPDASSTGEILKDVLDRLDVELTPRMAEALYIAIVTDTGRFQYRNTSSNTLRLAAELIDAGADSHRVFQDVYENVAFGKLKLLARALDHAAVYEGGRLIISSLTRADFSDAGAEEPYAEGLIDHLRAVEGAQMVALIREPPLGGNSSSRKVSLRTASEEIDVSLIARGFGGGGHRQAAGFSTEQSPPELVVDLRQAFRAQANDRAG